MITPVSFITVRNGLVVKWLSRLPVTEEIAGSSPVGPAKYLFTYKCICVTITIMNYDKSIIILEDRADTRLANASMASRANISWSDNSPGHFDNVISLYARW